MPKYILMHGTFYDVDDLAHASPSKGKPRKNHKYVKREWKKDHWEYTYKDDKKSDTAKATTQNATTVGSNTSKQNKSWFSKIVDGAKTLLGVGDNAKKVEESVKENVHKYVAKVPTGGDEYKYFYSEESYQAYSKGKDAVDNALDKQVSATPSDVTKANAKNFLTNALLGGFGQALYKVVAPALAAIQVALTTPKSFSELEKIPEDQTNDEHQEAINPEYTPTTYDYSMNCSFCTAAYDLRKRGYDVEANPISQAEAYTLDDIASWYEGSQPVSRSEVESFYKEKAFNDYRNQTREDMENGQLSLTQYKEPTSGEMLMEALKSNGEGSRGHLCLCWTGGGGHDVIWEVQNGEVVIRDCQTGTVSKDASILSYVSDYAYIRTDNLEPTEKVLRTVRNKKKG